MDENIYNVTGMGSMPSEESVGMDGLGSVGNWIVNRAVEGRKEGNTAGQCRKTEKKREEKRRER